MTHQAFEGCFCSLPNSFLSALPLPRQRVKRRDRSERANHRASYPAALARFELVDRGDRLEPGEIEALTHDRAEVSAAAEDVMPAPAHRSVSRTGDVWKLGEHRLMCGDARSGSDMERLMDGARADMVFTDPPYNVAIAGHVKRSTATLHGELAMASGEMSDAEFCSFLETCLGHAVRLSRPGAVHDVCMDWRHVGALASVGWCCALPGRKEQA